MKRDYDMFLAKKTHTGANYGFDPVWMPDDLFDFQETLVEWATRKGRSAIFADCGMGKTPIQLTWAENVARYTGKRVLILTPLAVTFQTVKEGEKFGVEVVRRDEGIQPSDRIVVTNYERLHYFNTDDFIGVVCDESSCLKNYSGKMRKMITEFMRTRPYRLLCTATAAPNDYIELGTSSEALGEMGNADMLSMFFKRDQSFTRIANRGGQGWHLRGYAESDFWRWICSWARALRKPSDMGFEDGAFKLPPLQTRHHVVEAMELRDGYLFELPAVGLQEQREDLRRTIGERCDMVASLINSHDKPAVAWCNLNKEGNLLAKAINGAVEVSGSDSVEHKEETFRGFVNGDIRVLVTKPAIGGFGLNLQHCAHMSFFPSHSYEQYYQAVRRCWRFGQKNPVVVDMITTKGQDNVLYNLERKAEAANKMFDKLVQMMWREMRIEKTNTYTKNVEVPEWLSSPKKSQSTMPSTTATA
ncbi:MAG: helicase-related protein [bacterium]